MTAQSPTPIPNPESPRDRLIAAALAWAEPQERSEDAWANVGALTGAVRAYKAALQNTARRPAMTDTLPADLRRHAERRTLSLPIVDTMMRAADEIERLRAERAAPAVDGDAGWPDWRHHDTTEERRRIMSRALAAADRATGGPSGWGMAAPVTLAECPIGLFRCGDTLALKTEYGNNEGRIDAYIVESGEFFWGDPPQTVKRQRAQIVYPVIPPPWATVATSATHETPGAAGVGGGVNSQPTDAPRTPEPAVFTREMADLLRITAKNLYWTMNEGEQSACRAEQLAGFKVAFNATQE